MPVDAAVIADKVQRVLAAVPAEQACDPGYVAHTIRAEAGGIMSDVEVLSVLRKLRHDSVGVGPLEQVLSLPGVTDVLVNGTQGVWFDRGRGLEAADIGFASEREVRQLATRLLVSAGRRLDDTQCFADGQLSRDDGSSVRVHAILSPPAQGGTCISLRVLRHAVTSLETLCERGTMSGPTKTCLQQLVAARRSFLVIGGTGSGKTTLLAALLGEVSHRQRIIASRTPPSYGRTIPTFWGWCPAAPTLRARGRSPWPICSSSPCGCGPTGLWWGRSGARRLSTSWPP